MTRAIAGCKENEVSDLGEAVAPTSEIIGFTPPYPLSWRTIDSPGAEMSRENVPRGTADFNVGL
jgi:hypothetical protein